MNIVAIAVNCFARQSSDKYTILLTQLDIRGIAEKDLSRSVDKETYGKCARASTMKGHFHRVLYIMLHTYYCMIQEISNRYIKYTFR